jgi:transcriptional regulator with GAF, ATPase, and Fis domain
MENIQQENLTAEQQAELENLLQKASKDNRINCASALAIAKSLGMPPSEVGRAANKLKIKISNCQLGCF